jgi:hypothetical protein
MKGHRSRDEDSQDNFLLFRHPVVFCFIAHGGEPYSQRENTEKVIAYLIDQAAKSHLTFTRNGTE